MLKWITKAFLTNRSQSVSINGVQSSTKCVLSGVPQGSILGPVLFLLYINDISSSVKSSLRLFADDCILYREICEEQDCWALQDDLNQLSLWSKTWQLNFNVKKCYHLGVTCKKVPTEFQYVLNGQPISRVSSAQYLGITVTDNLCWNEHINNICKKANSTLGLLRRILSGCDKKVKDLAYRSLVRPKLEYGCSAWNPYTKQSIDQIEMVQRRAARFVCNDYSRFSHVTHMIEHLGWDSLEHRRLFFQTSMFYKILNGHVGICFPPEVRPNTRATRLPNTCPFKQISVSNNVYKFSFYPRTITIWNNLPITDDVNLNIFKSIVLAAIKL